MPVGDIKSDLGPPEQPDPDGVDVDQERELGDYRIAQAEGRDNGRFEPALRGSRDQAAVDELPDHRSHARVDDEFGADQENRFLGWLSGRLGEAVQAPDLADLGYKLVGGRLLPAAGQPAAQLMYENADAKRITLYIRSGWPSPAGAAHDGTINFAGEGGLSTVYWIDGPFAYALLGELDREQLFATAKIIQQQRSATAVTPEPAVPVVAPEQTATAEKGST